MRAINRLVTLLRDPASASDVPDDAWAAILSVARAEVMLGTLAHRLADQPLPPAIAAHLAAAARAADHAQTLALWEAEMCRRALAPFGITPILLKGCAYALFGLPNAAGRQIGDCDILVARDRMDDSETALLAAGWEWVKDDAYDQAYYRQWMHELPPLIHAERDRMVDVHHTILPLTAAPKPDAAAMIADALEPLPSEAVSPLKPLPFRGGVGVGPVNHAPTDELDTGIPLNGGGLLTLAPTDMLCHAAAHMLADGDLAGGPRNLWDIDQMLRHFSAADPDWWPALSARAAHHQLTTAVGRALRLSHHLYATPVPPAWQGLTLTDRLFIRHLLARDDWGRETQKPLRLAFYIRSHLLRMPLPMLLRHLWTKWRKGA